jgi:hypothetical protein
MTAEARLTLAHDGTVTYTEPEGSHSEILELAEDGPSGPENPFERDSDPASRSERAGH